MPIASTNQPKPVFSFAPLIDLPNKAPIRTPVIAITETVSKNIQLVSKWPVSPIKPDREVNAMMKSDVPIAFFIGKCNSNTNAGINKKPPPAPRKPVTKPMLNP